MAPENGHGDPPTAMQDFRSALDEAEAELSSVRAAGKAVYRAAEAWRDILTVLRELEGRLGRLA